MTPAQFARFVATAETDYLRQVVTLYPTKKTIYGVQFENLEKWLELDTPEAWGENKPEADVVEVKHGKWNGGFHCYECSVCGSGNQEFQSNYCPQCGAKMKGDF